MALMGCGGSRAHEAFLKAIEDAVKENALNRLEALLEEFALTADDINHRSLLHSSAWLGNPRCVEVLLKYGANPDLCHRKNGCTPLHLAHFCTIDETHPGKTIRALITAGANVNNPGNHKCGTIPLDHAIQHQRLDSIKVLLDEGSLISMESLLISIDVANTDIAELLLRAGGQCGKGLSTCQFWGETLARVLHIPRKGPRVCYSTMFKLFVQATVCQPLPDTRHPKKAPSPHIAIEKELRNIPSEHSDLSRYLFSCLVRSGFYPTETIKILMLSSSELSWVGDYLSMAPSLQDICVRVARSHLLQSGNVIYGVHKLQLPVRLNEQLLLSKLM